MRIAKNQIRHPHDVEHPSPRKSTIHPKIFSPQPSKLNAKSPTIMIAMIPRISICLFYSASFHSLCPHL